MHALDKTARTRLERTVRDARDTAEAAARAALDHLGVAESKAPAHLTAAQQHLRRRLRDHGRQLGDALAPDREQTIDRLVEEVAYEHWHRMLFARFLAANTLLMCEGTPVSLDDCDELAPDYGARSKWDLAARLASTMLPRIFRADSPVFDLDLPPEQQRMLERLVDDLPDETFTAADALGWVYQYWQARRKDDVNAAEVKIGARELPAVTQLFTEPYMVEFLLDNTIGAWHAARTLDADTCRSAPDEDALRRRAALEGVPLRSLRFVRNDDEAWQPAAGGFEAWPDDLAQLTLLDPCCGSGHFLVSAFRMLVPLRIAREQIPAREAVDRVLAENLFGLELDPRCVELAAFALALAAWTWPGAEGWHELPPLHLACTGLSISVTRERWLAIAGDLARTLGARTDTALALGASPDDDLWQTTLRGGMEHLYDTFAQAPLLGSLIRFDARQGDAFRAEYHTIADLAAAALARTDADDQREAAVTARGLSEAAALLARRYTLVLTNVPYLARGKQHEQLRAYCEREHPDAKHDLATVFLERCLAFCDPGGSTGIVLPQNWLFLGSYRKLRARLLRDETWNMIVRMGSRAFDTITGEVVNTILLTMTHATPVAPPPPAEATAPDLFAGSAPPRVPARIRGIDVSAPRTPAEKAARLLTDPVLTVDQHAQLANPDARVALEVGVMSESLLIDFVDSYEGIGTGDLSRFQLFWWETELLADEIVQFRTSTSATKHDGGDTYALLWRGGRGDLHANAREQNSRPTRGYRAWGDLGVAINRMRNLEAVIYRGEKFDCNIAAVIPKDPTHLPAIWCYCSSPEYNEAVRQIDQSLKVTNATLVKVPFDLEHWTAVAKTRYPHGLPEPYSDDPTQWIFHGHPCGSVVWDERRKRTSFGDARIDETVLQVAVARLVGYRWPAELAYDVPYSAKPIAEMSLDELEAADPAISAMPLAGEQRALVDASAGLLGHADRDGVVCIPPVRGEASAAERLLALLYDSYGAAWTADVLPRLLAAAGHPTWTLERWLRDGFFAQHCRMFGQRPFVWQIWDGLRDGFSALVLYHRLDAKLLDALVHVYLGDWMQRQRRDVEAGVDGAATRLAAAEQLARSLMLIQTGEAPHDIFVRWKSAAAQPVGWEPDLDDGVRLNIRPFLSVPDVGRRGAGILRERPNIDWKKDRGRDVTSAPWYAQFAGERLNDHHLTLDAKLRARRDGGT